MNRATLLEFGIERLKSFWQHTSVEYAPLTVIVGRNNCGKSTLIQALLLLKQTVTARSKAPLHLDGVVSAFNLRELTSGWPQDEKIEGPVFSLKWRSRVESGRAFHGTRLPDVSHLIKRTRLPSLDTIIRATDDYQVETWLEFGTGEEDGATVINWFRLGSSQSDAPHLFDLRRVDSEWKCFWRPTEENVEADQIEVEFDAFLPYLRLDRSHVGPKSIQRAFYNAWLLLFAQPLEALKGLLLDFQYLGSTRLLPPSLYKPASVAPEEIGVSGELAAQLLHRRQRDVVHYLPALEVTGSGIVTPPCVVERPLVDAVNEVLQRLSVPLSVTVDEIRDAGFRLLFGSATLQHVGRGLTYLLPLVELGLFTDPLRFQGLSDAMTLSEYQRLCGDARAHLALEEPEAHLHPKVQSHLAHWLVSLAMANRSLLVETHSDHLVRRLRGLVARAGAGSALESWLLDNVLILEVEQDSCGRSTVHPSRLTADGSLGEHWPADFMDEAAVEDSVIYYAGLEKAPVEAPQPLLFHEASDAPEEDP